MTYDIKPEEYVPFGSIFFPYASLAMAISKQYKRDAIFSQIDDCAIA